MTSHIERNQAMQREYVPIKVGASGTKVHAGYKDGKTMRGGRCIDHYQHICGVVNTHYINRPVGIALLPAETEINCQKCLEQLAKEESINDKSNR